VRRALNSQKRRFPARAEYDWFDAFPEALTLLHCGQALRTYRRLHALDQAGVA
jgi:hypothetical protein